MSLYAYPDGLFQPNAAAVMDIHLAFKKRFVVPALVLGGQAMATIPYTAVNYPGLGRLITSICDHEPEPGMAWFYLVNGILATVGIADYVIRPGDRIEWILKSRLWRQRNYQPPSRKRKHT